MLQVRRGVADPSTEFVHIDGWAPGPDLAEAVDRTIATAEAALGDRPLPHDPDAADAAGAEALTAAQRRRVSDIRDDPGLSAALVLHRAGLAGSLHDPTVVEARTQVDRLVAAEVGRHFDGEVQLFPSGHFWYPPTTGMGWHTNHARPGWRAYVTRTDVAGRSWFRYADPSTGALVTSDDQHWDLRLFRIDEHTPFWHAVWSGCHRHSFGYHVSTSA